MADTDTNAPLSTDPPVTIPLADLLALREQIREARDAAEKESDEYVHADMYHEFENADGRYEGLAQAGHIITRFIGDCTHDDIRADLSGDESCIDCGTPAEDLN